MIFETVPNYTVESVNYCNMGVLSKYDSEQMFEKFPFMKKRILDEILWNPYDPVREDFIKTCRKHIRFLANADDDQLKIMYHRSK